MNRTVVELLRGNSDHAEAFQSLFDDLQDVQHPEAVTVCCSDSRVMQDHLWSNDVPGRLFTCGNIGNRVVQRTGADEVVSGDVLYPILHAGTETVVVVGHTGCGAVTAAYERLIEGESAGDAEPAGIGRCLDLLTSKLDGGVERLPEGADGAAAVNRLVEYNVDRQVEALVESDDVPDRVDAVGAVYDFQDAYPGRRGQVYVVNVDGERSAPALREAHPEVAARIERLWEY